MAQEWLAEAGDGAHGGLATGAPECGVCPVCRAIRAVRAADPALVAGVVDALAGAAASVAAALQEAADRLAEGSARPEGD
jgi:hypothetical protein